MEEENTLDADAEERICEERIKTRHAEKAHRVREIQQQLGVVGESEQEPASQQVLSAHDALKKEKISTAFLADTQISTSLNKLP